MLLKVVFGVCLLAGALVFLYALCSANTSEYDKRIDDEEQMKYMQRWKNNGK